MGTRRCQSKMAIERDLGKSGRTASVDQTEARNARDVQRTNRTRITQNALSSRRPATGKHCHAAILRRDSGSLPYVRPRLLLLDELGYLPIDERGADVL